MAHSGLDITGTDFDRVVGAPGGDPHRPRRRSARPSARSAAPRRLPRTGSSPARQPLTLDSTEASHGHPRHAGLLRQGRGRRRRGTAVLLLAPVPEPPRDAAAVPRLDGAPARPAVRRRSATSSPRSTTSTRWCRSCSSSAATTGSSAPSPSTTRRSARACWPPCSTSTTAGTPSSPQDWTAAYTLVAQVMVEAAEEAADEPAWWEAEVVGARAAHLRRRGAPAPAADALCRTSRASRSRWRPSCGPGCGATTRPPTRRARTAGWRSTSRPGTAVRSARRWSARPASATCCGSGRRWATSPWTPPPTATCCSSPAASGSAPLKALVDQIARQGPPRRVDLFVGARIEDELYDRADLRAARAGARLADGDAGRLRGQGVLARARRHRRRRRAARPLAVPRRLRRRPPAMVDDTVARLVRTACRPSASAARCSPPADRGPALTER